MIVALAVLLIMLGWVLLLSVAGAVAGVSVNVVAIPVLSAGVALLAYGLSRAPREGGTAGKRQRRRRGQGSTRGTMER